MAARKPVNRSGPKIVWRNVDIAFIGSVPMPRPKKPLSLIIGNTADIAKALGIKPPRR